MSVRIKKMLDDIVDIAYPNDPKLSRYKQFYIEVVDSNKKSRHGVYRFKGHCITINNLYRDDTLIMITCIHELSHHIDTIQRGISAHKKEFYAIYKRLLYASFDMEILDRYNVIKTMENHKDTSDCNKVIKMAHDYVPHKKEYKQNLKKIIVDNGYPQRKVLQKKGFSYNAINRTWEKDVDKEEENELIDFLAKTKLSYSITKATDVSFHHDSYIVALANTYEYRERLKEEGFFYDKKSSTWKKTGTIDEALKYKEKYPSIKWGFDK